MKITRWFKTYTGTSKRTSKAVASVYRHWTWSGTRAWTIAKTGNRRSEKKSFRRRSIQWEKHTKNYLNCPVDVMSVNAHGHSHQQMPGTLHHYKKTFFSFFSEKKRGKWFYITFSGGPQQIRSLQGLKHGKGSQPFQFRPRNDSSIAVLEYLYDKQKTIRPKTLAQPPERKRTAWRCQIFLSDPAIFRCGLLNHSQKQAAVRWIKQMAIQKMNGPIFHTLNPK